MDSKINNIDAEIRSRMKVKEEDLKIAMSVPGIGFVGGSTVLAEIGNYQSADKLNTGKITKRGSKHLRWILVEIAQASIKVKRRTKLRTFFQKNKMRQGFKKAIVALARKILCILHHLLTNREPYKENDETPIKSLKLPKDKVSAMVTLDEMIKILSDAGYVVSKPVMG